MTVETYYTVLGIDETASQAEMKSAYRDLVRQVHPDSVPNASPIWKRAAEEKTKEINEAYDVLSNELKRREYDRQLDEARRRVPSPTPDMATRPSGQSSSQSGLYCGKCGSVLYASGYCPVCRIFATSSMSAPPTPPPSKKAHAPRPLGGMDVLVAAGIALVLLRIIWVSLLSSGVAYKKPATAASINQPPALAVTRNVDDSAPKDPAEVPSLPSPQSKLSSLTFTEQQSIESVCSNAKYVEGPAAYNRCLDRQLEALAAGPRQPDLSDLTPSDQQSIESACSSAKYVEGPAVYNRCLMRQLETLSSYYHHH